MFVKAHNHSRIKSFLQSIYLKKFCMQTLDTAESIKPHG